MWAVEDHGWKLAVRCSNARLWNKLRCRCRGRVSLTLSCHGCAKESSSRCLNEPAPVHLGRLGARIFTFVHRLGALPVSELLNFKEVWNLGECLKRLINSGVDLFALLHGDRTERDPFSAHLRT